MIPLSLRLKLVKALIVLAFIAGFILSPLLWSNEGRLFAIIKPIDAIPALPAPFDLVLLFLFIVLSAIWIFSKNKVLGIAMAGSLLIILAQDQMRWQPWVYIYLLMMLPYLFQSGQNEKSILNALQLTIPGVYIWSGLHKLSPNFIEGPFAQIIIDSKVEVDFSNIKKLGYYIPLIETSMGIMLLIPKFRKIGLCLAISMHLMLLFYLSQWATVQNSIVYPWNMAMILFVILLFWRVADKPVLSLTELKTYPLRALPLLLVWILPVLNLWGYWDHYLSFSFYSNKPSQYYVAIKETELNKIDKKLHAYLINIQGLEGGKVIDFNKWTLSELNVPFYPERRLFLKVTDKYCKLGIPDENLFFIMLTYVDGQQKFEQFSCSQLQ